MIAFSTGATPTGEEAAAAVAALETLLAEASGGDPDPRAERDAWLGAALLEGVSREGQPDLHEPWIKT